MKQIVNITLEVDYEREGIADTLRDMTPEQINEGLELIKAEAIELFVSEGFPIDNIKVEARLEE